jgi:5-deoxy-glucuronate isomerase
MHIKQQGNFAYGYNSITEMNGKHSDMLMDFGILKMKDGDTWVSEDQELERAFLLVTGHVTLEWEGNKKEIKRENCFDENPICLHVAKQVKVSITAHGESEIVVQKTDNENTFESKLYDDCLSERFGAGTMQETSTRTVRTIFDARTAPYSNLVVGEVINHPGKWSSYPPHHHPQPEIYYYKFLPEKGYGHSEEGDNVYKVTNSDTVTITPGLVHSQCAAPGYAMFYVWMIRNLRDNPFGPRIFLPEHEWVAEKDAKIWPDK